MTVRLERAQNHGTKEPPKRLLKELMAATPSLMLPLGTAAPEFNLPDSVSGKSISLSDFTGRGLVVMFICNHCPFVKHIQRELVAIANQYQEQGVDFVAISSNDPVNYPEDAPEKMREVALRLGYPFPYLFDEGQDAAKAYRAACTPDFFVFDNERKCFYRGQLDDSRPDNNVPVTGKDLRTALDALVAGQPAPSVQKPSLGCNIKWR